MGYIEITKHGNKKPEECWVNKHGSFVPIKDMSDTYLVNCIEFTYRNYRRERANFVMGLKHNEYYTKHDRLEEVPGYTSLVRERKKRGI